MGIFQEKFPNASAEFSWLLATVRYNWEEFIRSHVRRRKFSDVFQAAGVVSKPEYGFLPEEAEEIIHQTALRRLSQEPTTLDEANDMAITAAYTRFRWGSENE